MRCIAIGVGMTVLLSSASCVPAATALQPLVDATPRGGTLILPDDRYSGAVIRKPITIVAANPSRVDRASRSFEPGGAVVTGRLDVESSNVTLRGLLVDGVAGIGKDVQNEHAAVRVCGDDFLAEHLVVQNCPTTGVGILGADNAVFDQCAFVANCNGIGGTRPTNSTIKRSLILRNNRPFENPAWAGADNKLEVDGGWVLQPAHEGGGGKVTFSKNFRWIGNYYDGNYGPAIWADAFNENFLIEGNVCTGGRNWQHPWDGGGIWSEINISGTIRGNHVHDNDGLGIGIQESSDVLCEQNLVVNDDIELRAMPNREPGLQRVRVLNNYLAYGSIRRSIWRNVGDGISVRGNRFLRRQDLVKTIGAGWGSPGNLSRFDVDGIASQILE